MTSEEAYRAGYQAGYQSLKLSMPEIVRCKDCKNWVGNGADIDELPYWYPCKCEIRQPGYFCADGERKNEDD